MTYEKTGHKRAKYKKPKRVSKDYYPIFATTLQSYLESRFLIDIGNIPSSLGFMDPAAKRPMRLVHRAEHCADIENAVRAALHGRRHLEDTFDQLLTEMAREIDPDPALSLNARAEVVQLVGAEFQRRRVAPWLYFQRSQRR